MKPRTENPSQLTFSVVCPPIITKIGDDYTVRPGKPILKLSAAQLAAQFNVDAQSIYRWRQEGLIPDRFVHRSGLRKLMFDSEVVPHLQTAFRSAHE